MGVVEKENEKQKDGGKGMRKRDYGSRGREVNRVNVNSPHFVQMCATVTFKRGCKEN